MDQDRRSEDDVLRLADAAEDRGAGRKGARNEADDWGDVGTEDPAFYLKPSDED